METRSATLGDRIYNYRTWQRRWTPDISFPCRCSDIDDHHLHRAHEHVVMVDGFSRINADIDMDIMAASMKDQYFLHQRFTTQLRKLARRWHAHGSSLLTDLRPVLTQLIDTHRSNLHDRAHWTSTSLQRTAFVAGYLHVSNRSFKQLDFWIEYSAGNETNLDMVHVSF